MHNPNVLINGFVYMFIFQKPHPQFVSCKVYVIERNFTENTSKEQLNLWQLRDSLLGISQNPKINMRLLFC